VNEIKLNIGVVPTKNYNKVSLELLEEYIEYEDENDLKEKINKKFDFLIGIAKEQFEKIEKVK